MSSAQHRATRLVDPGRFIADQPRAGKSRERAEIDMTFIERILPGDVTRQHAGIRCLATAGHEDHAHTWHRPHAEALQDMHVRVPAAEEDKMLVYRAGLLLHLADYARVPAATPVVPDRSGSG